VISVAAGDLSRQRGSFSSNGLELDNGRAVAIGADGHTVHRGDRIGLTQPDIMAPGVSISSSCDSTGSVIGPCPDHGNTSASGTSMSAPHIAGAAAVLLQANPRLTPAQVQLAMKATASPVRTPDGTILGSHQVGYGHVNLDRAVTLVKGRSGKALKKRIARAMRTADRRLARQDDWKVARTDQWQSDALPVAVDPLPFFDTHELRVAKSTDAVKLAVVYPTPGTAANLAEVTATLVAADGTEVGSTSTDLLFSHGTGSVLLEDVAPGDYTLELGGYYVSDPDTLDSDSINGRVVFVSASQLKRR
jgi:serine protease AprX